MLIQHGFGDARGVGDVVHRRGMESLVGEHLQGNREKLIPAGSSGKAGGHN